MLDINPLLLLTVFVVFLVSLALLNSWLFKPMLDFMEKREDSIANDLKNVKSNSGDIGALEQESEQIIAQAKKEANDIRDKAVHEAKQEASQKIEARQSELNAELEQFMNKLADERTNLKNSLLSKVPLFKENFKAKLSQL